MTTNNPTSPREELRENHPYLKPCPFCGSPAQFEPWHGGAPTKIRVSCSSYECEVCPDVTGENEQEGFHLWNTRPPVKAASPEGVRKEQIEVILRDKLRYSPHPWDVGRLGDIVGIQDAASAIDAISSASSGATQVQIEQAVALMRAAMKIDDRQMRDATLQAAIDFATNDEEALAEGRRWAPEGPADA